jgi:phage gp29-like protein
MLGLTDGDIDVMVNDAEAQAQAFISAEQSYLVENAAVSFDTYAAQPNLYADGPISIITKCDSQIAAAFLTQFADLGNTETGARSVGEIHLSVFRRAAINLCDLVASQVSGMDRRGGGTIGRLIKFNYGPVDPSKLPRLTHTGLDTDDLADSMAMLPQLVQAGLLTPDNELERALRERLGAGDLPEEAQRSAIERTAQSSGGGGVLGLTEALIRRKRNG